MDSGGNSQVRRKLTKKPPSHHHAYSITGDGRFDAQSLNSKRSSTSLKRAPSAPPQRSSNASSSPRHLPSTAHSQRSNPSPILQSGEFLPSTFSPTHLAASRTFPASPVVAAAASPYQFSAAGSGGGAGGGFAFPGPAITSASAFQSQPTSQPATTRPAPQPPTQARDHRLSDPHLRPLSSKTSQELVGAPFDGTSILNHIETTKQPGYQSSLRRPAPPPLAHTSPSLRQSASFSSPRGDASMGMSEKMGGARIGENQLISPKRYSDEAREAKPGAVLRKKSGFSGLVSSLVGSPKKPVISAPENPVHVTHVGYDSSTGQFTVRLFSNISTSLSSW